MEKVSYTKHGPEFNWYSGFCFGKKVYKVSKGLKVEQKL